MLFNSFTFLLFFIPVYGLFWLLPGWASRKSLLLVASYVFYAAWNPPYVILLMLSTLVDWLLANRIAASASQVGRRLYLLLSLICNLGMLSYFKYGNFVLDIYADLGAALGWQFVHADHSIILPIGISFYTFASLSYTVDVYRGVLTSRYSLRDYALFVSFFPHLVAGPILKANILMPQLEKPVLPDQHQVGWGFCLFLLGLFCKLVLADTLFAPLVNEVYAHPEQSGILETWCAVFSFSGQIYFDFCGYSLCAIGLAKSMGFYFPENFNYPYTATSFSDFWRRWHISLSSWLRDYLYIPLGGNRHGWGRTYLALFATMLIGGLWHGASWMFVLWGALHGSFLIVERACSGRAIAAYLTPAMRRGLVFILVTLAWIPFRANSLAQVQAIGAGLFGKHHAGEYLDWSHALALAVMALVVVGVTYLRDMSLDKIFARLGMALQIALLCLCLMSLFVFSGTGQNAFLYFQF
ncbi:MBOAT family O-acyltransferase [Undibacterium sp. Ji50W]|uniref:MBOAT family O-acyltransferase n=1 Tax=Undibacterium sp. Ji50W TaxID=3413041 RepID=UPI003BF2B7A0